METLEMNYKYSTYVIRYKNTIFDENNMYNACHIEGSSRLLLIMLRRAEETVVNLEKGY